MKNFDMGSATVVVSSQDHAILTQLRNDLRVANLGESGRDMWYSLEDLVWSCQLPQSSSRTVCELCDGQEHQLESVHWYKCVSCGDW